MWQLSKKRPDPELFISLFEILKLNFACVMLQINLGLDLGPKRAFSVMPFFSGSSIPFHGAAPYPDGLYMLGNELLPILEGDKVDQGSKETVSNS